MADSRGRCGKIGANRERLAVRALTGAGNLIVANRPQRIGMQDPGVFGAGKVRIASIEQASQRKVPKPIVNTVTLFTETPGRVAQNSGPPYLSQSWSFSGLKEETDMIGGTYGTSMS